MTISTPVAGIMVRGWPDLHTVCRRALGLLVGLSLILLISGCSNWRMLYNPSPTLGYWWLNRYLDFDSRQRPVVQDGLYEILAWHRTEELPRIATLLQQAQQDVRGTVTAAQVCAWQDAAAERLMAAGRQMLPLAARVGMTLSEAQWTELEQQMIKSDEKLKASWLSEDPEERLNALFKSNQERLEMLYGRLDRTQRTWLRQTVAKSPFEAQRWKSERIYRREALMRVLREAKGQGRQDPEAQKRLEDRLGQLLLEMETSPRRDYLAYRERLTLFGCTVLADFHNTASPAQRRKALERLREWEQDALELSRQKH